MIKTPVEIEKIWLVLIYLGSFYIQDPMLGIYLENWPSRLLRLITVNKLKQNSI